MYAVPIYCSDYVYYDTYHTRCYSPLNFISMDNSALRLPSILCSAASDIKVYHVYNMGSIIMMSPGGMKLKREA